MNGLKIITAQEMARIENSAYEDGASDRHFMESASDGIAAAVEAFIETHHLPKVVTLLVGKGNNAGDTYAAGAKLLKRKYHATAWAIYPLESYSPLCRLMHERFLSAGGDVHLVTEEKGFHFEPQGIILDGLVGTGFRGRAEGLLALAIAQANHSHHPILAVDIPSGLNGTTGEVATIAIRAERTLFLEIPKSGFFLGEGFNCVGKLEQVPFGLENKYYEAARPVAYLFDDTHVAQMLPPVQRVRHKYQAGYVLGFAGSPGMPGAALLASSATLRAGAGIVRLFHPGEMEADLSAAPYELLHEAWDGTTRERVEKEAKRAKAVFVGPGMGRDEGAEKRLYTVLGSLGHLPMVIDADALFLLAEHTDWPLPKRVVLTPHSQEMQRLLQTFKGRKEQATLLEQCQAFAEAKHVTIVLKGAPNFIFHPGTVPLCIPRGDPGMATAGSGDVLTGVVAALLAQGLEPREAAALGVYLHAVAGEHAAEALTSYSMTASDLLDFLPEAFKDVRP